MRKYLHSFSIIFLSFFLFQCQKELSHVGGPDPVINTPAPITTHLQGTVYTENNLPAQGVTIRVGSKTAVTDNRGYFRIMDAALDKKSSLVTAEMNGYFKAYRTFAATSGTNQVEFKLVKRELAGTISGSGGGDISLSNGAKVALKPNGVVVASSGAAYSGQVNVYAAYIDPTSNDIARTVPGSFMANDASNNRVLLESYGMMAVELESISGEKLQIKTGSTATLTMPIPSALQSSAPANMPLWYVDESTGIWKEEGSSAKIGNAYIGEVKHFTYWNCDLPMSTIPLTFKIVSASGQPLAYAYVRITRQSHPNHGSVHGIVDSLGQGSTLVPAGQGLVLSVYDPCGVVIFSQNIGPFSQSTNLGNLIVSSPTTNVVTVTGVLQNCSGGAVTSGFAAIYYNNTLRYAAVNANGEFSVSFIICGTGAATAHFFGVDQGTNQQGANQVINITSPTTNVGSYSACGVSSLQYMNYTLDGVNYNITNSISDSLVAWTSPMQTTTMFQTYMSGVTVTTNNGCAIRFQSAGQASGSYPLANIYTNGMEVNNPPISVNITNFAQMAGQFYEGNFSGSFTDAQGASHSINATFRLRRVF